MSFLHKMMLPLSLALVVFGAGILVRHGASDLFGLRARYAMIDQRPTVVHKIRSLARLETVSFTEQKVLEGRKEWPGMPQWLLGDRMMFLAHGEVVAGVDLSTFGKDHLRWEGKEVKVRLPEPKVFHVRLDNRASRVYTRSKGWINGSDDQLETRVRQKADDMLLSGALQEGILDHARRNAEKQIGQMLKEFGAQKVTFI